MLNAFNEKLEKRMKKYPTSSSNKITKKRKASGSAGGNFAKATKVTDLYAISEAKKKLHATDARKEITLFTCFNFNSESKFKSIMLMENKSLAEKIHLIKNLP
jgi:hypothetical protein